MKFTSNSTLSETVRILRLNIIFVVVRLAWYLNSVALGDDADIALDVSLAAARRVLRVCQHRPLVVELSVCSSWFINIREARLEYLKWFRKITCLLNSDILIWFRILTCFLNFDILT